MRLFKNMRIAALAPALALAGCVSFGGEVPDSLLTLTPDMTAPAGSGQSGTRDNAIAVHEPEVPAEVDVLRIPVKIDTANIAYLELEKSKMENPRSLASGKPKTEPAAFTYKGHFQFRTESADNQRGIQGTRQSEQSFFRLRPYFTFSAKEDLKFNLTPQATKGFGANNGTGAATSGSTTHSELFFFEANIDYMLNEDLSFKVGRQELSYGDHLVIGALPWANTGRSFDGAKLKFKHGLGWSDLFFSKISDNSTTGESGDDANLLVSYNSFSFNSYFKNVDFYFIHQRDNRTTATDINMLGFRLKGKIGPVFYRTENGTQNGANIGNEAFQYNLEVGGKIADYSLSLEYAMAGHDYRQLYPTAHKFLGFADVLGRRNVKQTALHFKGKPTSWLGIRADYHIFQRNKDNQSAYRLNGATAIGTTGTSKDIGNEFDLVLTFKATKGLKFQLGGALFNPGEYMKDNDASGRNEAVKFFYGQINASF